MRLSLGLGVQEWVQRGALLNLPDFYLQEEDSKNYIKEEDSYKIIITEE